MSETIEIEFKNMLTEKEYRTFLQQLNINQDKIFTQENHYFDTHDFALKETGCALRVRVKTNQYEMTLKQPASVGLLETTQDLTEDEFKAVVHHNTLPDGIISDRIFKLGVSINDIVYFGSLITKRVEIPYRNGLLVFDHSLYLGVEDFELEYEVAEYQTGYQNFTELLRQNEIPLRQTENKIRRFYRQKYLTR